MTQKERRSRARRREKMKAEVRDVVFRLCAAGGLFLALPWALSYEATPPKCPADDPCVGEAFSSTVIPMLTRCGIGLAIGVAVGMILCLTVPGLKRRPMVE
jgi:hypothetical protein